MTLNNQCAELAVRFQLPFQDEHGVRVLRDFSIIPRPRTNPGPKLSGKQLADLKADVERLLTNYDAALLTLCGATKGTGGQRLDLTRQIATARFDIPDRDLPLMPSPVKDNIVHSQTTLKEYRIDVINPDLAKIWAAHARTLDENAVRAVAMERERIRGASDHEMVAWLIEHGSPALAEAAEGVHGRVHDAASKEVIGRLRGAYVRERCAREHPGWTPIPDDVLTHGFGKLKHNNDICWNDYQREADIKKTAAALEEHAAILEPLLSSTGWTQPELRVRAAADLAHRLEHRRYTLPPALALDLQDDTILAVGGIYVGYTLVRSSSLRATKDRMWQTMASGVRSGGRNALVFLPHVLEDPRWQTWMRTLSLTDDQRAVQLWIDDNADGIWTVREVALATMMDLTDTDHEAMLDMSRLMQPLAASAAQ